VSLRGIARSDATQQSEAIPIGIASTIILSNDNDHDSILGSLFLEAMPIRIAKRSEALLRAWVTSLRSSQRHQAIAFFSDSN